MAFSSYRHQAPSFMHAHEGHSTSFYPTQLGASPPGQMDTSGYLPPFLLGSPAPKSPSHSRPTSQLSTGLTPGLQGLRTSSAHGGSLNRSHMGMSVDGGCGRGGKVESKSVGGPPVQGLYDQPTSPARTRTRHLTAASPERMQLNFSGMLNTAHKGVGVGAGTPTTLRPRVNSTPGTVGSLNMGTTRRSPPSPAQMDPFYSQGENLTSDDNYNDHWVTIFGFPAAASSYILEQFSQYGTILKHVVTSNGNWMHILYQSRIQAKKALSKNGKVYGNGIMVGVQPCIDKSIIEGYSISPTDDASGLPTAFSTPSTPSTASTPGKRPSTIRPLTAAYHASSSQHQVAPSNPNTPQKSTGFFSKALEYMFGW